MYHTRGKLIHGHEARRHPLYATWSNMKGRCGKRVYLGCFKTLEKAVATYEGYYESE